MLASRLWSSSLGTRRVGVPRLTVSYEIKIQQKLRQFVHFSPKLKKLAFSVSAGDLWSEKLPKLFEFRVRALVLRRRRHLTLRPS